MRVCVRRHACQEFFWGEGAFGGCMCMHARTTCTYCMNVCTLVEQLCCIQLLHTRAHAEQVLKGRLTFPFLISFFFFFLIFFWFRLLLDLFIHEVLLVCSLFSMLLLSFLQWHTKIRASNYLLNIMEEVQFVSSNIEKAFEQCSCMWSDVGGTQHETIYLLIIKCIYFMNSYLECTVWVFFLIKSENSLMHGLFHNCSFMHKLLIISCTGTCPVWAVNMSVLLMTAFPLKLSVTNSWTACRFLAWIFYEQ